MVNKMVNITNYKYIYLFSFLFSASSSIKLYKIIIITTRCWVCKIYRCVYFMHKIYKCVVGRITVLERCPCVIPRTYVYVRLYGKGKLRLQIR